VRLELRIVFRKQPPPKKNNIKIKNTNIAKPYNKKTDSW